MSRTGVLFLSEFLTYCHATLKGFPRILQGVPTGSDFVYIRREFSNALGRPDIVIFSNALRFAIIIENKIDAADQERQLERYWTPLNTQFPFPNQAENSPISISGD